MNWRNHIVSEKDVLLGKPIIKGTRVSVELVLELLATGWTEKMILDSYKNLNESDLKAVYAYLRDCVQNEFYFPIPRTA